MSPRILLALGALSLAACTSTAESSAGGVLGAADAAVGNERSGDENGDGGNADDVVEDDGEDPIAGEFASDDGRPPATSIVMIGDSITVASLTALDEEFAALGHPDPIIEAQVGKRIASTSGDNRSGVLVASDLLSVVEQTGDLDHSDALWVVALGTNDINQYGEDELAEAVDELLDVVPSEARLIWVDTYHGNDPVGADEVNRAIVDALDERGDGSLAAWSAVASSDDGNLRTDLVHPSDEGAEAFARLVAETAAPVL